jgi:hypothetical protein
MKRLRRQPFRSSRGGGEIEQFIHTDKEIEMFEPLYPYIAPALGVLLAVAGCSTPPTNLDLAMDKATAHGTYRVALIAPAGPVAINKMHAWQLKVTTPDGQPVHDATVEVDGGMPQHGHGLPTHPRVTREVAPGTYVVEGMKFSMPGWWEVKLDVRTAAGHDNVTFNTVLDSSGARK